jgi:hypothetical protein
MVKVEKIVFAIIIVVVSSFGGMVVWFAQAVNDEEATRRFLE